MRAVSVVVCLVLLGLLAPAAQARSRPNVLVVETDDQTQASMPVMPQTLRLLGDQGVTFTRSFVNNPLCCPSRATLYTGQYAHNHGVVGNGPPAGGYTRLDKGNYLPLWLQAAGYRTMHVGKFLNGYGRLAPPTEVPPGWNEWHTTVDPSTYQYYGYTINENGTLRTYGAAHEPALYSTDVLAGRADELITAAAPSKQPFFLSVAFLAPHNGGPTERDDPKGFSTPVPAPRHVDAFSSLPLPLPPSFNEADVSDKPAAIQRRPLITAARAAAIQEGYQQRLESLLAVDDAVASIVATLEAAGELDNTLILFTSDNGYLHGEHRVPSGKVLPYEPSIRVPLLMRGPGVPAGERRGQLVTNADLAPTIMDVAEARPWRRQDGRSLLDLVHDPSAQWGRELLIEAGNNYGLTFRALRNYRFKYVEHITGETELYDLEGDPDELDNVARDPALAPLRRAMSARLAALWRCVGRGCRAKPNLLLRVARRSCRFDAAVRGPEARKIEQVEFLVRRRPRDGTQDAPDRYRRLTRDRSAPFRARLLLTGVRPGHRFRLRARVRLDDGRALTLDTRRRTCREAPLTAR